MTEYKELLLSREVAAGTIDYVFYMPKESEEIRIYSFSGHAAYSVDSSVSIRWGTSENNEVLYSTKGDVTEESLSIKKTGNGTDCLMLCLENGENGTVLLSGKVKFVVKS